MEYGWTEEHVAFRQQVRDFLDEHATPADEHARRTNAGLHRIDESRATADKRQSY